MHAAEIGDLRKGKGGFLDQPHGGGLGHKRKGHGFHTLSGSPADVFHFDDVACRPSGANNNE
jgi:hypothetical protein